MKGGDFSFPCHFFGDGWVDGAGGGGVCVGGNKCIKRDLRCVFKKTLQFNTGRSHQSHNKYPVEKFRRCLIMLNKAALNCSRELTCSFQYGR